MQCPLCYSFHLLLQEGHYFAKYKCNPQDFISIVNKFLFLLQVLQSSAEYADLDEELKKILQKLVDELKAKRAWVDDKTMECYDLRRELYDIYSQIRELLAEKEKQILGLTKYLTQANEMARLILDDIEQLKREYRFCQKKIDQYKVKFAKIERTRHLGYLSSSAPDRANLTEIGQDKARAKAPIQKPRIIKVQATGNLSNNIK